MSWETLFAYIIGSVDEELLKRNEYLATENRVLRGQIKGQLLLTDAETICLLSFYHREEKNAPNKLGNTPAR